MYRATACTARLLWLVGECGISREVCAGERCELTNSIYRMVVCTGQICSVSASSTHGISTSVSVARFAFKNQAFGTNPSTYFNISVGGIVRLTFASCEKACRPDRLSPVARARRKVTFAVKMCLDSCSSELSGASRARNTTLTSHEGTRVRAGGLARSILFINCEQTLSSPGL